MISRSPFLIILITGLMVAGRLNYLIFWIKYRYQHQNGQLSNLDAYAEDIGETIEEALAYPNLINDGKPTGIESDEQYYELQKQVYGDVIIDLSWLI